jgi:hypothetical protein
MTPEELLRRALEARADAVEVAPDALRSIRTRIVEQTGRRRQRLVLSFASLTTAVAVTVIAVVVGLGSCVPSTTPPPPGETTSPATSGPPNTGPPSTAPATSGPATSAPASNPPPATVRTLLPVYYVGTGTPPRLYREYHSIPVTGETLPAAITAALDEMLANDPVDPDYWSPWLVGTNVRGVRIEGSVAVIDLAGTSGPSGTPVPTPIPPTPVARAMIQQLVWTVTAVSAEREAGLDGVRLLFEGVPRSTYWGADVSGTLHRGAYASTAAPLWVISPQEGSRVSRTFDVHLAGSVFEATARLRVRDSSGEVVSDQQVMLSAGAPAQGDAHVSLTLPPGSYTIEAYFLSAKDGTEQGLDDHSFTVG